MGARYSWAFKDSVRTEPRLSCSQPLNTAYCLRENESHDSLRHYVSLNPTSNTDLPQSVPCKPLPLTYLFSTFWRHDKECTHNVTLWRVPMMFYLLSYPNSLIPFHRKQAILWRFHVVGNKNTCLGLNVKWKISRVILKCKHRKQREMSHNI